MKKIITVFFVFNLLVSVFAGEIKDIMSIPFGASHDEVNTIMITKNFTKASDCRISFDTYGGAYDIVQYDYGTFAGRTNVTMYVYFFQDRMYCMEAYGGGSWQTVLDAYISKYSLTNKRTNSKAYYDEKDNYVLLTTMIWESGIRIGNMEINNQLVDYAEKYEKELERKKQEELERRRKAELNTINGDI